MKKTTEFIDVKERIEIEYFWDLCENKAFSHVKCHICGRDICSKCEKEYDNYKYCKECYTAGKIYIKQLSDLYKDIQKLNDSYIKQKVKNMQLWKEDALKQIVVNKED